MNQVSARQGMNRRDKIAGSDFEQLCWPEGGVGQEARNKAQFSREQMSISY
jgi:hypothetical protein